MSNTVVHLGSFDTKISAKKANRTKTYATHVDIPWQFNDFRNLDPYTTILLYLPAYGFVHINPADAVGDSKIRVTLTVDGVTGKGVYQIGHIMKVDCDLGVDMMVGTITNNAVGYAQGTLNMAMSAGGAIAGALTGNMLGAAAGVGGFAMSAFNTWIASQERTLGSVGGYGALASVTNQLHNLTGGYLPWNHLVCITISHSTNVDPSTVGATIGRPCNKVVKLSDCNGFVQCSNASVKSINTEIAERINTLLNGGVYIE